jgi:hypothetical protein
LLNLSKDLAFKVIKKLSHKKKTAENQRSLCREETPRRRWNEDDLRYGLNCGEFWYCDQNEKDVVKIQKILL